MYRAQRYCVYLCSRKLLFTQDAEENVLWISLWRFNIFSQLTEKKVILLLLFQVDYLIPVTKHQPIQHDNVIMKNMLLHYSFLLFYLLPRLWITFSDPFVNHAIKTMLCYTVRDVWLIMNFLQKKQFELVFTQLYLQPSRFVFHVFMLVPHQTCILQTNSFLLRRCL